MPEIIELRPKKELLNGNFEKYQFSPENITVTQEKRLNKNVFHQEPSPGQDSWLEARLFGFHNHLFVNPFDSSCWFCDEDCKVWKFSDGILSNIHTFCKPEKNFYNPTISFASSKIIALTSGGNNLEILISIDGDEQQKSIIINDIEPGVLMDAKYVIEKSQIIVAMCSVSECNNKKFSKIIFLTYSISQTDVKYDFIQKHELTVNGPVDYIYIESNGENINMLSQASAKFTFDSEKEIENDDNSLNQKTGMKIPKYCWSQDEECITVWVKIPEKYLEAKAKIKVTPNVISVEVADTVLIQGESQFRLDSDSTTWSKEKDTLKLELMKNESGQMWSELIKGDTGGECLPNEALAAEIHSRLSHLCTDEPNTLESTQPAIGFNAEQLEECDLEGKENYLQRINMTNSSITHLAMLGTHNHLLFTHKLISSQMICVRYDHDGCVWNTIESDSENWEIHHTSTFPGFGYVEASKSNKKFCIAPPNCQYVAIVEHSRNAFFYERPIGDSQIAKQRIIDLGSETLPIMGAAATNEFLFLLTKDKLYQLKVT